MSPTSREREYAKRRYEKWQGKQVVRNERRRRQRRIALTAAGAVAVVTVAGVGISMLVGDGDGDTQTTAASSATGSQEKATGEATLATSTSTPSGSTAANPCPPPNVKAADTTKSWPRPPAANTAMGKKWSWTIETSCGPIAIELDGAAAPQAVASTVFLVQQGFYSSTPCHRLTTEGTHVLQCGDPTGKGTGGPGYTYGPVENAPKNNVYPAGTIAMARQGGKGDSMGSQFFIVYKDSTIPSDTAGGYTVIGKVTGGLGAVSKVAAGGASPADSNGNTAPVRAVSIVSSAVKPQ